MHKLTVLMLFTLTTISASSVMSSDSNTEYRRVLSSQPGHLDPALTDNGHEIQIIRQIFDTLIAYDKNFSLKPALAEDWKIENNRLRYIFKIRKDVKFFNGTIMTVDDVVFSLKRLITEPSSVYFSDLSMIKGAVDYRNGRGRDVSGIRNVNGDLIIELNRPNQYLLSILASSAGSIMQKRVFAAQEGFSPIGTGPFIVECNTIKRLILKANQDYYKGKPNLSRIIYTQYPNKTTMYEDFVNGRLDDIAPYHLPKEVDATKFKHIFTNSVISYVVTVNSSKPPLNNKYIRQALIMAINREAIFANLHKEYLYLIRSTSFIPKGRVGYDPDLVGLDYNPAKALELIHKAGYKSFAELPLISLAYTGGLVYSRELVDRMTKDYSDIGVKFKAEMVSHTQLQTKIKSGQWEMAFMGADTLYPDSYFMVRDFHSQSPIGYMRRDNSFLNKMIEQAFVEPIFTRRVAILKEINKYIVYAGYVIPLYSGDVFDGTFQPWVEGIEYPQSGFSDMSMYPIRLNSNLAVKRPFMRCDCENQN